MLVQSLRSVAVVADPTQLEILLPRAVLAPAVIYSATTVSVTSSAVVPSDVASAACKQVSVVSILAI